MQFTTAPIRDGGTVRPSPRAVICAVCVVVTAASSASATSFTIDEWAMGTIVNVSPGNDRDVDGNSQAQSPFQTTHYASVPPSFVQADYDIAYSQTFGRFLIESSITALGGPFGTSTNAEAIGTIVVSADAPLAITLDGSFNYNLPPVSMTTILSFRVVDIDDPVPALFDESRWDTSWTGEGAAGTLAFNNATTLPGGHTYWITYRMSIDTGGGPQTTVGTGDGYLDFTLQIVPEPATATLLICALPLMRHWRRR